MEGKTYLAGYQNKRLNEVVIPGAHDAGIYLKAGGNVQTQSLDIGKQAEAGCRFFDMRIAAHKTKVIGGKIENQAYHLGFGLIPHSVSGKGSITKRHNVSHLGGWGGGLDEMLQAADAFVKANGTEFLILKFSKCKNWPSIAEACIEHLKDTWYRDGGNLNNKLVKDLKGKVITVFDEDARPHLGPVVAKLTSTNAARMASGAEMGHGIMYIRALYDKETGKSKVYDPNFWGMQYFGKFSDTPNISKNTKKQKETLINGASTHIDVMGMMYWTTTGLLGNIKKRNNKMWKETNIAALQKTWESGLESAITARLGNEMGSMLALAHTSGGALGGRMKAFMPNIVMMDFVDADKCKTIQQLNGVASTALLGLLVPTPSGPRANPGATDAFSNLASMSSLGHA